MNGTFPSVYLLKLTYLSQFSTFGLCDEKNLYISCFIILRNLNMQYWLIKLVNLFSQCSNVIHTAVSKKSQKILKIFLKISGGTK